MFDIVNFEKFSDGRGDLIPLELGDNFLKTSIPFEVKRFYFIAFPNDSVDIKRGNHAHHNLQQLIICASGSFTLDLEDFIGNKESLFLDKNTKGVHIKKGLIWRQLKNFSPNCVVLVFANQHFDEKDYIRSYQKFKELSYLQMKAKKLS